MRRCSVQGSDAALTKEPRKPPKPERGADNGAVTVETACAVGNAGTITPVWEAWEAIKADHHSGGRTAAAADQVFGKDATYEVEGGVLTVTFRNGRTYTYNNVPLGVVIGFVGAGSQGAYYDEHIKGKY
jgi:KTSC domain